MHAANSSKAILGDILGSQNPPRASQFNPRGAISGVPSGRSRERILVAFCSVWASRGVPREPIFQSFHLDLFLSVQDVILGVQDPPPPSFPIALRAAYKIKIVFIPMNFY